MLTPLLGQFTAAKGGREYETDAQVVEGMRQTLRLSIEACAVWLSSLTWEFTSFSVAEYYILVLSRD